MKGERLWHYLTLLLGKRAARVQLAEPAKRLPPAVLRAVLPVSPKKRLLLAVLPAVLPATNKLSATPSDRFSEGNQNYQHNAVLIEVNDETVFFISVAYYRRM